MEYKVAAGLAKIAFILYKLGLISQNKFYNLCDTLTVRVLRHNLERDKNVD